MRITGSELFLCRTEITTLSFPPILNTIAARKFGAAIGESTILYSSR